MRLTSDQACWCHYQFCLEKGASQLPQHHPLVSIVFLGAAHMGTWLLWSLLTGLGVCPVSWGGAVKLKKEEKL